MYARINPNIGQEILISINSRVNKLGVTYNSLCCFVPRKWEHQVKEYLSKSYPVAVLDKEKKLIPMFVNNVSSGVAQDLVEDLKVFLRKGGLPFIEHEGRVKDEVNNTSTNHKSPYEKSRVGYVGNIRPWRVTPQQVHELNKNIVRVIPDKTITVGEITEERLLKSLEEIKDRNVEIILSNKGSHLDVIGKDLVIIHKDKVWGFQIKCSALDAYLHQEKYPQEICLWVNPDSTLIEVKKLALLIKNKTWKPIPQ